MSTNKPTRQESTGLDAIQAGRLAQRHYELREEWQAARNWDVADAMLEMGERCQDHGSRTGWVAYFDGRTTTYHYTDPTERPQL